MFRIIATVLILAGAGLAALISFQTELPAGATASSSTEQAAKDAPRSPVLVELFTSEGCSSCPPADELLSRLEQTQPVAGAEIIPMSEHVDYWNRLGWTDPYSSALFSARQNDYAQSFNTDDIYTPQMVVDGRVQFVGSNRDRARDAIAEAARSPKATVRASLESANADSAVLAVEVGDFQNDPSGDSAEVMLAVTESGLRSSVSRGENAGRRLSHTAVVRRLSELGKIDPQSARFTAQPTLTFQKNWKRENLRAVIFVQQRQSRRVIGAVSLPLAR